MEPGVEAIDVPQAAKVTPSLDERLLDGIVGEVPVAQHQLSDRVEAADGARRKLGERSAIAAPRLLDEISPHSLRSLARTSMRWGSCHGR